MTIDQLTKEKILNAAEKRMVKFGYRKVTMDEIAQDLVMSKNTIYKYFQSKAEITENLFLRLKKKINDNQILIEKAHKDPLEIISKNIYFLQKELTPWFEHFLGDIKAELPTLWTDFVNYRAEKIMDLKTLVEKGIKKGIFRKVNAAIAVRAYLGAIDSIINPEVLEQEKVSFHEALEIVLNLWSEGMLAKK
ncbi:MAG TPA: TetR/AcrR family transcriptional regulator [Candidatus Omnitrophota bacterium]|nr:TetR/AcrR family transcriptional regulator [Candidatus Omnitrophota bacterium]HPD84542.1 TetR/AcrR family transcriptional regulator [Candidatus Omnitrophota bacterium]HRZ03400.1 TetR/AcrR family transcriptional regulator [Candidatus Omnitrophota bacterium]